uniref:IncF plasmid conjugative transfer pilus assembly protein TraK n=1 Tax=Klebsiella pneumoniae TaxID=573 RepID=A0A8B0SSX0_KLEPN|nr:IncF plasmid conjugative transfer pilus assembly protein TraK [Klebsiella pneumoniae]
MLSEEGVPESTYNLTLIPHRCTGSYDSCSNTVNAKHGH